MDYTLYPVGLREPLPCIPVPLAVDYSGNPVPPLREEDTAWANVCLRAAGLRPNVR